MKSRILATFAALALLLSLACGDEPALTLPAGTPIPGTTVAPEAEPESTDAAPATPTVVAGAVDATVAPTAEPAARPTVDPTEKPTAEPTMEPAGFIASLKEKLGLAGGAADEASKRSDGPMLSANSGAVRTEGDVSLAAHPASSPQSLPPEAGGLRNPNEEPLPLMYFQGHGVNPFVDADEDNRSTFSLDGDTGSLEIARLYLEQGSLPPPDSVRVEEWVNSLEQGYSRQREGLGIRLDGMMSPFGPDGYRLLRVGIASARPSGEREPISLIYVLDISGSMDADDRLGLAKIVMVGLFDMLREGDRVGLVTYGSEARVDYPLTDASRAGDLVEIISGIRSEGATNLAEGIFKAYELAAGESERGRRVRVVVLSDGVGNIGATGPDTVLALVDQNAQQDAAVTAIGVGISGNYNDVMMEALANRGNGTYHYLRGEDQAADFLLNRAESVFREVARDARVQVEFNPDVVRKYRLIGYENRAVADDDFRDDSLDFGEVGFARDVTALYELRLNDGVMDNAPVATVYLRWADGITGKVNEVNDSIAVSGVSAAIGGAAPELVRSAAVAEIAELLRKSYWAQCGTLGDVSRVLAEKDLAADGGGAGLPELLMQAESAGFVEFCMG